MATWADSHHERSRRWMWDKIRVYTNEELWKDHVFTNPELPVVPSQSSVHDTEEFLERQSFQLPVEVWDTVNSEPHF